MLNLLQNLLFRKKNNNSKENSDRKQREKKTIMKMIKIMVKKLKLLKKLTGKQEVFLLEVV